MKKECLTTKSKNAGLNVDRNFDNGFIKANDLLNLLLKDSFTTTSEAEI